jgi:hypothetical protein
MVRKALLISVVIALTLAGATDSASALRRKGFNCSPILGYCKGIVREDGRFKFVLILESPSAHRSYTLCVTPPRGSRECKSFKLVGGYSSIDFARNFSSQQKGRYAVSWKQAIRLGPILHFTNR